MFNRCKAVVPTCSKTAADAAAAAAAFVVKQATAAAAAASDCRGSSLHCKSGCLASEICCFLQEIAEDSLYTASLDDARKKCGASCK